MRSLRLSSLSTQYISHEDYLCPHIPVVLRSIPFLFPSSSKMPRPSSFLSLLTLSALNPTAHAYWRTACSVVQTGRIDPILSPDTISGHVHKIAGGSEINPYSTFDSLLTSTCSSCQIQADKSAYWTPQLYYAHNNGSFEEVPNEGMTVYYVGA